MTPLQGSRRWSDERWVERASEWVSKPRRGVPPFGHSTQLRIFIYPELLQYDEVWAAAGTWNDVFGTEPLTLVEASDGLITDLKRF